MNTDAGVMSEQIQQQVQQAAPQMQQMAQQVAEPQLTFVWWLPFIIALILVFTVEFVRALPFKKETLAAKPFSCDACMTGWSGIGIFLLQLWLLGGNTWQLAVMHTWPAMGVCILLLSLKAYWKPQFPTES